MTEYDAYNLRFLTPRVTHFGENCACAGSHYYWSTAPQKNHIRIPLSPAVPSTNMASGEKPINLADLTQGLRDLEWEKVREMAIQLKFNNVDLDDIEEKNSNRQRRLSKVSEAWLKRDDKASWEEIVKVLKHIKENVLANELEKKYCKQSPSRDREVVIQSPSRDREVVIQSPFSEKAVNLATSSAEVQKMIDELEKKFELLKKNVRECIEKHTILMETVINALTQLSPGEDDQHKIFIRENRSDIVKTETPFELFVVMNDHWNYLNPPLLNHLVQKLELNEIKDQMEAYKSSLEQFRIKTPLTLFVKTQTERVLKPLRSFKEMVAEFKWPENSETLTLEIVEQFRKKYAHHYNLHECAMMLSAVRPGSFVITWFISECMTEILSGNLPTKLFEKYYIVKLKIAGTCVYHSRKTQKVSAKILVLCNAISSTYRRYLSLQHLAVVKELKYLLVLELPVLH